jgi:hypothetical protein
MFVGVTGLSSLQPALARLTMAMSMKVNIILLLTIVVPP